MIGEHTDYNDGFVLPGAIDKYIYIAIGKAVGVSTLHSLDLDDTLSFDVLSPERSEKGWGNYVLGVVKQLQLANVTVGNFQAVFAGDIPQGAGLSSSAALECGFTFGLSNLFSAILTRQEMARIGQQAEHDFVGVQCGVIDQFATMIGKRDHVFLLDCRSLAHEYHQVKLQDYEFVLINSCVHHELTSSEYNLRRSDCENGVKILNQVYKNIASLRDVDLNDLQHFREHFPAKVYDRCRYVIEESVRVKEMVEALDKNLAQKAGELMFETHKGLSKLYEVSCEEIDFLVALAGKSEGIIGARMMGAGFGGCTLNLIERNKQAQILPQILKEYEDQFELKPQAINISLVDGVSVID